MRSVVHIYNKGMHAHKIKRKQMFTMWIYAQIEVQKALIQEGFYAAITSHAVLNKSGIGHMNKCSMTLDPY